MFPGSSCWELCSGARVARQAKPKAEAAEVACPHAHARLLRLLTPLPPPSLPPPPTRC